MLHIVQPFRSLYHAKWMSNMSLDVVASEKTCIRLYQKEKKKREKKKKRSMNDTVCRVYVDMYPIYPAFQE